MHTHRFCGPHCEEGRVLVIVIVMVNLYPNPNPNQEAVVAWVTGVAHDEPHGHDGDTVEGRRGTGWAWQRALGGRYVCHVWWWWWCVCV